MTFSDDIRKRPTPMASNTNLSQDPDKSVQSQQNSTRNGQVAIKQSVTPGNFDVNDKVNIKNFIKQQQKANQQTGA